MTEHEEPSVDNPIDVTAALNADAASDAHLVEQRRAELAELRHSDPKSDRIKHIEKLIGRHAKPAQAKPAAKRETAARVEKRGAEQRG